MQIAIVTRVLLLLGLLTIGLRQVGADELKETTSLRFVPKTASFYATTLRLGEQWQRFASSKAFAKLHSLPLVKEAVEEIYSEWEEPDDEGIEKIQQFLTAPENQNLILVGRDAFQHEIFSFGDEHFGRILGALNELNRKVSNIQLIAEGRGEEDELLVKKQIINELIDSMGDMQIPHFVFGFRTSMPKLARAEIERAKNELETLSGDVDELRGRISEVRDGDTRFVVARFDGSQIPWDEAIEENPDVSDEIRRIRDKLSDRQVKVAFGLFEEYIVFIVTPDEDVTDCFQSKELLIDSTAFDRLRSFADRKLTSISYVSDEFIKEVSNPKDDLQQINLVVDAVLPKLEVDESIATSLRKDVKQFVSELQELIPTPGAMLSFTFLTKSGYEGYQETWAQNLYLNASEPLEILQHAGGNPIAVMAVNSKKITGNFVDHWIDRAAFYFQEVGLKEHLEEEQWDLYVQVRDKLLPIIKDNRQVTKDHWNKAFTSGQSALIVDSALEPKTTWHLFMPPSEQPLPMLEFAWVTPLTDRSELEEALKGYRKVQENLLAAVKGLVQEHQAELTEMLEGPAQMLPVMLQTMQVPQPLEREIEDGTIRHSAMLQQVFVDAAIAPNFGWNSDAFAYSLSPQTTERVLQAQDISGPLAKTEGKKLAMASYVDFSRLIGVFRPWVTYGMDLAKQHVSEEDIEDIEEIEEIAPQVETILDVLQCYHRYYSITWEGDNSLVTHSRSDFRDLP